MVLQVLSKDSLTAEPSAKVTTTIPTAAAETMVPIKPVTNPAVALPRPVSRPLEASICRVARRPMTIAGIPDKNPRQRSDMMPNTRAVVASPELDGYGVPDAGTEGELGTT